MKSHVEFKGVSADREVLSDLASGSRASMVGGHMKSAAPIDHPEPTIHFTGADTEYFNYLFNDIAEDSGDVYLYRDKDGRESRAVFTRHARLGDPTALQHAIFFRRPVAYAGTQAKPMIDLIETSRYTRHDHIFTSEKRPTEKLRALIRGETTVLEKDDILTEMNCMKDGEFIDGVNLPTITISHPDIIEDSYTISKTAANLMHSYGFREIELSLREDEFLMDTYGREVNGVRVPQYFPNIGQAIRDDGLVIASRQYDPLYAAIDASLGETQHPSPFFDHCEYVDADPEHYMAPSEDNGSRVIDIQVWRDEQSIQNGENHVRCTEENKRVLDEYALALKEYYRAIVRFYFLVKEEVVWSPRASVLLDKAFSSETYEVYNEFRQEIRKEIDEAVKRGEYKRDQVENRIVSRLQNPVQRSLRDPINTYTIRIVVRYPIPVTVSSKITDRSGTKGIVGAVRPDDEMPINELGERVHVMRSANAVLRRSTYSGLFHIYWSAASEQLKMKLKPMLEKGELDASWAMLMDYVARYNPDWANGLNETHPTTEEKKALFAEIYDFTIRLWLPHELDNTPIGICESLGEFTPKKTKLLMTNYDGIQEWTKNDFYVGYVETLRLDKTGREFSSISSMYLNFLGTIDASNSGRGGYPINFSAKKWGGESERRLASGYGEGLFDEIHNRANSNVVHREVVTKMYQSDTPSNAGYLIDRKEHPLGESQIDRMIRNIHRCEGFELIRPPREDA